MIEYKDVFSKHDTDNGWIRLTEHVTETGGAPPVKSAPRCIPLSFIEDIDAAIQKFFDQGSVCPSKSPWASPWVFS